MLEGLGTSVVEPDDDEAGTDPAGKWIGIPNTTVSAKVASDGLLCTVLASERWWRSGALDTIQYNLGN